MNKVLIFLLFSFTLCSSLTRTPDERKRELKLKRKKLLQCLIKKEGISDKLKNHLTQMSTEKNEYRLHFKEIETVLTGKDKVAIADCMREISKIDSQLTRTINSQSNYSGEKLFKGRMKVGPSLTYNRSPISNGKNLGYRRSGRKLEMLPSLGKFKLAGVFECLEYAQDAIKIIRGAVNMIRSMDYTSAIISIYDNLSMIGDALSYCFNAILPSE